MMTKRSRVVRPDTATPGIALWAAQAQSAITALEEQLALSVHESADLRRELYEAAQMQRSLCGPRLLRRGSFEIAAELFPVRHLSGDFFCIADLGATIMLAIGDICGKGLPAGMWFLHILELTKMYGGFNPDPAAALRGLNRTMCGTRPAQPMTSMFLAYMD